MQSITLKIKTALLFAIALLFLLAGCTGSNSSTSNQPAIMNSNTSTSAPRTLEQSLGSVSTSNSGIHVSGSGSVVVEPDITILSLAVESTNRSLSNAASQNARTSNKILTLLKGFNVNVNDIKTQRYSTQPVYRYTQQEGQKLEGYKVSNNLEVTLRSIDENIGIIIDELVQVTGSDDLRINQISFQKEDTAEAVKQARTLAAQNAIEIADLYASEMGVSRGSLLYIADQNSSQYPKNEIAMMADIARSATTPIIAGDYKIEVTIRAVFSIN